MTKSGLLAASAWLMVAGASPALAQDAGALTLEHVFASSSINGPTPRQVKLSPDGKYLTSLRPRPDDRERFDLWFLDTRTGEWRMLVDSTTLGTSGVISEAEKMQRERARIAGTKGIVAYDWSADSQSIMVPVDGDLFLADLAGKVTRLTETPTSELDSTVSPKGAQVSFVRDQNLVVRNLATGREQALTRDGGGTLSYGVAEFVAQEEMDRTRGHWWAPDDSAIAYARVDESGVRIATRAAIGAEGARMYEQRYPFAGTDNARVDLFVWNAARDTHVKVDLGPNPDIYLARVDWTPDGKSLLVQRQSRDQKRLDMLKVDAATGAATMLFSETGATWLNLHDDLRQLADGSLIWTSERDGFSHIYRFRGGKWSQITRGPWAVKAVVGVNEAAGRIYFTANPGAATQQHLYSVPLQGGAIKQLTDPGTFNSVTMNKAATRAIVGRSSPAQPAQVYLADAGGKRLSWIEENRLDASHPYAPFLASHVAPVFGSITAADGTELKTKMLLPKMQPGKRYPVFLQVYGGPGVGRQATESWGGGALHQYLVDQGWIVFSLDNRGSPDRGKAFEDHLYQAMGGVEVVDQLKGVEWLKTQPFVDPGRIGVYGWSYGGYMALKMLQAAPGTFAAGVAGAPVTKWELYDTHYTERFLGDPRVVPEVYTAANVAPHAARLSDPLLLIHGMADDNVVFDHSTALMAAMQGNAQPFETMVYPGQTHAVTGPKVQIHLWQSILAFLDRNVKDRKD